MLSRSRTLPFPPQQRNVLGVCCQRYTISMAQAKLSPATYSRCFHYTLNTTPRPSTSLGPMFFETLRCVTSGSP